MRQGRLARTIEALLLVGASVAVAALLLGIVPSRS